MKNEKNSVEINEYDDSYNNHFIMKKIWIKIDIYMKYCS